MSSALPMVSALMPVLSERKNTGTDVATFGRVLVHGPLWDLAHRCSQSGSPGT